MSFTMHDLNMHAILYAIIGVAYLALAMLH